MTIRTGGNPRAQKIAMAVFMVVVIVLLILLSLPPEAAPATPVTRQVDINLTTGEMTSRGVLHVVIAAVGCPLSLLVVFMAVLWFTLGGEDDKPI